MSDPLIIQTLKQKRAEISGVIAAYQAKIAQARHDLAHINAVIRLVEGGEQERAQYIVSHGFFKKGEIADICLRHLKLVGTSPAVRPHPTHFVFEVVEVFKETGGQGGPLFELAPGTTFAIVKSVNGWLVARDGKELGYIEEAKAHKLQ